MNHKVKGLIKEIKKNIEKNKLQQLLDKKYDGFKGSQFLRAIEAAYLECRYPVPNPFYEQFPFKGLKDAYEDPVYSSGLYKFCYEFCRLILSDLKAKFGIGIPASWLKQKITGDEGQRFGNLFFGSRKEDFISQN